MLWICKTLVSFSPGPTQVIFQASLESYMPICCYCLVANLCLPETPWTVAHHAPLSMGFPRQEYWNGLPFPSPGDLPDPGIEPRSPALQADSLPSEPRGKPIIYLGSWLKLGVSDSKTFLFLCAFYCLLENLGHYAVLKDELVAILSALDRRAGVQGCRSDPEWHAWLRTQLVIRWLGFEAGCLWSL